MSTVINNQDNANNLNNLNSNIANTSNLSDNPIDDHYFKVFAAIDFGTNGTGLAYRLPTNDKKDQQIYIHDRWKKFNRNQNTCSPKGGFDLATTKPKTAILLDKDGNFKTFGNDALRVYMMMKDTSSMLFEHFKMRLYKKSQPIATQQQDANTNNNDDQKSQNNNQNDKTSVVINDQLTATNGRSYSSSKVFAAALKHLKKEALRVFKRNRLGVKKNTDVCWILTVPAIWDDMAKAKMREWAIEAGMIDPNLDQHLQLRYEPDCASLSIQHEIMGQSMNKTIIDDDNDNDIDEKGLIDDNDNNIKSKFAEKEIYILLDAGGGTVDVACHQILRNNEVKELLRPSGGPWGGMYIDYYFLDILCKIFNKDWIDKFKQDEPNQYLELLENFRISKWTFQVKANSNKYHNIQMPFAFIEFIQDELDADDNEVDDPEDLVNNYEFNDDNVDFNDITDALFELDGEILQIHIEFWKRYFFDRLIDPTINHCKTLLSHNSMKQCKYLCIAGGFGAIKYFQKRIRNAFGLKSQYKLEIIIPKRPILSVLDGAARMEIKSSYVQSRVLAKTYGDFVNKWLSDDELIGCTAKWKKQHLIGSNSAKTKSKYRDVFVTYCEMNDVVQIDDKVTKRFKRPKARRVMPFCVYVSDKETYFWTEKKDLTLLVDDELKFPDKIDERVAEFEIYFGDTTLSIYGQVKGLKNTRKALNLKC